MISLLKKYLDLNQYSNTKETFEDLYQSHPNYPSLFAITDSLDSLTIENVAAKIPKEQFTELPNHFLASYKEEIVFVDKTNELLKIEEDNGDKTTINTNDFLANWNGIILVIEPNTTVKATKNNRLEKELGLTFGCCILLILGSVFYFGFNFWTLFYITTSIIGIAISVLIVQEKIGVHNETVSKICNGLNTSCNSVIKSEKGKINKWIGFSDLPLVFFTANFLALLLSPFEAIYIIGLLSFFATPVLLYSIWLQKIILKKWCPICLFITLIIVFQLIVFVLIFDKQLVISAIYSAFYYGFSIVVVTTIWIFIHPLIENKIKSKKTITNLIRFKRNIEVFKFLSKKVTDIATFTSLRGITFGNSNANLKITLFLSPSCGHCHTAFQDAYNLAISFPEKIGVQILFNINPDNTNNQYTAVVENLLAINADRNNQVLEAIKDWHIEKMTLENWLQKWGGNRISEKVATQIAMQYNWCLANDFNYTPVKIVNTELLPNDYEIKELIYFLNDFDTQESEEAELIQETIL